MGNDALDSFSDEVNTTDVESRLVVIVGADRQEVVVGRVRRAEFLGKTLDELVRLTLEKSVAELRVPGLRELRALTPEVSVRLTSTQVPGFRTAFHLTRPTLEMLTEAGAELDFDPYVEQCLPDTD